MKPEQRITSSTTTPSLSSSPPPPPAGMPYYLQSVQQISNFSALPTMMAPATPYVFFPAPVVRLLPVALSSTTVPTFHPREPHVLPDVPNVFSPWLPRTSVLTAPDSGLGSLLARGDNATDYHDPLPGVALDLSRPQRQAPLASSTHGIFSEEIQKIDSILISDIARWHLRERKSAAQDSVMKALQLMREAIPGLITQEIRPGTTTRTIGYEEWMETTVENIFLNINWLRNKEPTGKSLLDSLRKVVENADKLKWQQIHKLSAMTDNMPSGTRDIKRNMAKIQSQYEKRLGKIFPHYQRILNLASSANTQQFKDFSEACHRAITSQSHPAAVPPMVTSPAIPESGTSSPGHPFTSASGQLSPHEGSLPSLPSEAERPTMPELTPVGLDTLFFSGLPASEPPPVLSVADRIASPPAGWREPVVRIDLDARSESLQSTIILTPDADASPRSLASVTSDRSASPSASALPSSPGLSQAFTPAHNSTSSRSSTPSRQQGKTVSTRTGHLTTLLDNLQMALPDAILPTAPASVISSKALPAPAPHLLPCLLLWQEIAYELIRFGHDTPRNRFIEFAKFNLLDPEHWAGFAHREGLTVQGERMLATWQQKGGTVSENWKVDTKHEFYRFLCAQEDKEATAEITRLSAKGKTPPFSSGVHQPFAQHSDTPRADIMIPGAPNLSWLANHIHLPDTWADVRAEAIPALLVRTALFRDNNAILVITDVHGNVRSVFDGANAELREEELLAALAAPTRRLVVIQYSSGNHYDAWQPTGKNIRFRRSGRNPRRLVIDRTIPSGQLQPIARSGYCLTESAAAALLKLDERTEIVDAGSTLREQIIDVIVQLRHTDITLLAAIEVNIDMQRQADSAEIAQRQQQG